MKIAECTSLEIMESMVLGNWLQVALTEKGGLIRRLFRLPFHTQPFCHSVTVIS